MRERSVNKLVRFAFSPMDESIPWDGIYIPPAQWETGAAFSINLDYNYGPYRCMCAAGSRCLPCKEEDRLRLQEEGRKLVAIMEKRRTAPQERQCKRRSAPEKFPGSKRHGTGPRPRKGEGWLPNALDIQAYHDGASLQRLADTVGVSKTTVARGLRRVGITIQRRKANA